MFVKYAVNIDPIAEVQLIDGRIRIKIGGWEGLTAREIEHDDVVQAVRRNWIRLDDKEPTTAKAPEQPKPHIINTDAKQGTQTPTAATTPEADAKKAAPKKAATETKLG